MNRKEFEYLQRVTKYIDSKGLLSNGERVVIGLSGGADSVALLRILVYLREKIGIAIQAIHVHHGIRDVSADNDELFCRNLCRDLSVEYEAVHVDIPALSKESGESVEECARRIRYEILRNAAGKNSGKIAVAHHMDDQAETVFFRMIRGTGIKGLSAMRPQNDIIIRPLLCMTKAEILDYLKIIGQEYCTDETNSDDAYSRNRIRLNMIPEAQKICPETISHIATLSEEAAMVSDFMEKCADELRKKAEINGDKDFDESENCRSYKASVLSVKDKIIVLLAIRNMVDLSIHSLKDVTREHVESIYKMIFETRYTSVDLPKGLKVYKEGDIITFSVADRSILDESTGEINFCEELIVDKNVILPDGRMVKASFDTIDAGQGVPQYLYTKWLDYDKINPGLCVRFRQEGDFLVSDDKGSKKSLSRYMIDEKIPKSRRDLIPVIAHGSEIVWVIGYRISAHCKVDNNTDKIIKIEVKGEHHEGEN